MNNGDLYFDGKKYISSKRAAEMSGYSADYIGQLARAGKIDARVVGRSWFVSEESLQSHQSIAINALKLNAQKFASQNNKIASKKQTQNAGASNASQNGEHKIEINKAPVHASPASIVETKKEDAPVRAIHYPSLEMKSESARSISPRRDNASDSRISPFLPPLKKDHSRSDARPRIELAKLRGSSDEVLVKHAEKIQRQKNKFDREFLSKAGTFALSMLLVFGIYLGTMNAEVREAIANGARIASDYIKHPVVAVKEMIDGDGATGMIGTDSFGTAGDSGDYGQDTDGGLLSTLRSPWKGVAAVFGGIFERPERNFAQAEAAEPKKASSALLDALAFPFRKASSFLSSLFDVEVKVSDYYVTNSPATSGSQSSAGSQQIAQNTVISTPRDAETTEIYNQNIYYTNSGISSGDLDYRLDSLRTYLESEIASVSRVTYINNESRIRNFENLDLDEFENIDIDSSSITNSTITGGTITNSTITTTATTTTGGLAITSLDCSALGNGGKLTTDADGNVICDDDQGGGGGSDLDDLGDVDTTGAAYGSLLSFDGTNWIDIATSSLAISWNDLADIPAGFADGTDDGTSSALFGESFAIDSNGYLAPTTTISIRMPLGFVSQASSTIAGNLTVTGNSLIPYASSTAVTVSGGLYIGTLNGPLQANNGLVSATTSIGVLYGGTGLVTPPSYGQILVGNSSGGYTLTATSSLGINSAVWGSITGTLSDQTDLQNALDAKLSLSAWYATTTDGLDEGSSNLYYTLARFASALAGTTTDALDEGSANLYFTNARADARINATTTIGTLLSAPNLSILQSQISDLALFGKSWEIANGALSPTTTLGIGVYASSTIGSGAQAGGLTISGGATTTGNAYFTGNVGIGAQPSAGDDNLTIAEVGGSASIVLDPDSFDANIRVSRSATNRSATINFFQSTANDWFLGSPDSDVVGSGDEFYIGTAQNVPVFWIEQNGNLGIGTTSPYARLSVAGDLVAGTITATTSTSTLAGLNVATGGLRIATLPSVLLKTDSSGNVVAAVAGTDYASVSQTFGKAWEVAGNGYLAPTTTRGIIVNASSTIGSGAQAGGLTIAGGATTTGSAYIAGNATVVGLLEANSHVTLNNGSAGVRFRGGNSVVNSPSDGVFEFGGGSFDPDGTILASTLGLGTTSPFTRLSVGGSAYIGGNLTATGTVTFSGFGTGLLRADSGVVSVDPNSYALASSLFGKAWEIAGNGYLAPTTTRGIIVNASSTIGNGTQAGGLTIAGGATTTGDSYLTGAVTIGSNVSSQSQLTIYDSVGNSLTLIRDDSSISAGNTIGEIDFSSTDGTVGDYSARIQAIAAAAHSTADHSAHLAFYTTPIGTDELIERFRIASDGNVGIGTTSPYAKLSVVGQAVAEYFTATSSTASTFPYASTTALTVAGTFWGANLTECISTNKLTWSNGQFGCDIDLQSTGGGSGSGTWSTTTSQVAGQLINYSNTSSDIIAIGGSGTTTAEYWFDPNSTTARLTGAVDVTGALTADSLALANALGIASGGTGLTAAGASSTVLVSNGSSLAYQLLSPGNFTTPNISQWTNDAGYITASSLFGKAWEVDANGNLAPTTTIDVYLPGNLGIGTTSPYAKLSVVGEVVATNFTATATNATSTFAGGLNVGSGGLVYDSSSGITSISSIEIGNLSFDTDAGIVTWADLPVVNATAGTVESYIANIDSIPLLTLYSTADGSGSVSNMRVAVGTTTPYSRFSVWGTGTGTGSTFELVNSASTTLARVQDNGTAYFQGNLGIGTTSPYAKLSVAGSAVFGSITATTSTSTLAGLSISSGGLTIGTLPSVLLKTDSSGNVIPAVAGTDYASPSSLFGKSWEISNGALSPTTTLGIGVYASSTIGNGNQNGGLTISGGATTTAGLSVTGQLKLADSNNSLVIGSTRGGSRGWGAVEIQTGGNDTSLYAAAPQSVLIGVGNYNYQTGAASTTIVGVGNGNDGANARFSSIFGALNNIDGTASEYDTLIGYGNYVQHGKYVTLVGYNNDNFNNDSHGLSMFGYENYTDAFSASSTVIGYRNAISAASSTIVGSYITNDITNSLMIGPSNEAKLTILGAAGSVGNVGIGTTSPYAKLSVVGEVVATNFTATATNATSTFAGGLNVGSGGLVYDSSSGVTSISSVEIGNLSFDTDAGLVSWADLPVVNAPLGMLESYIAHIDGIPLLTLYSTANGSGSVSNMRVAVGTTTPYSRFSVWGEGTGTGSTFEIVNSASTTLARIQDNGTAYFQGNVGIGTTSPYARLSVAGDLVAGTITATTSTSTLAGLNISTGGLRIATLPSVLLKTDVSGNVIPAVAGTDYASPSSLFGKSWEISNGALSPTTTIGIGVNASSTIGNGTQAGGLTISGGATTTGNAYIQGDLTVAGDDVVIQSANPGLTLSDGSFGLWEMYASTAGDGELRFTVPGSGVSTFLIDSDRIVTDSSVNFGIGTTSPYSKLSVWGSGTGTARLFELTNSASTTLGFVQEDGTVYFRGNVGIGTTSPYAKLSVVGPVVAEYFHATSTTATSTFAGGLSVGNGALQYDFSSGETSIDNLLLGATSFETDAGVVTWMDLPVSSSAASGVKQSYTAQIDGVPLLTIYSEADGVGTTRAQRVGIGTTTPYARFTIWGTSTADNLLDVVSNASSTLLTVTSSGNVGIGTSSPYARLSVAGAIVAGNFTATTSTSTLAGLRISTLANCNTIDTDADGNLICGTDQSGGGSFGQAWEISSGALSPTTTIGIGVYASSTIGNGTEAGGLTISGGATTTGSLYVSGNLGIGTTSPWGKLSITSDLNGFVTATNAAGLVVDTSSATSWGTNDGFNELLYPHLRLASFRSRGEEQFAVYGNGSVAIGSSTQRYFDVADGAESYMFHNALVSMQDMNATVNGGRTGALFGIYDPSDPGTEEILRLDVQGDHSAFEIEHTNVAGNYSAEAQLAVSGGHGQFQLSASSLSTTSYASFKTEDVFGEEEYLSFGMGFASDDTILPLVSFYPSMLNSALVSSFPAFHFNTLYPLTTAELFRVQTASSTRFSILGDGTAYFSGNVGIGTTSPYAKLSVAGEVVANNFTATATNATSTFAGGLNVGNGGLVYDVSANVTSVANLALGALSFDTDAGQVSWVDMPVTSSASADTIESYSAQIDGVPLLTVYAESDGSGGIQNSRIGIGTTSPYAKLSVAGDVVAGSFTATTSTSTLAGLRLSNLGACTALETDSLGNVICGTDDTGAGGGLSFGQAWEIDANGNLAPTSTIDVYLPGNLGIGTTSPYAKLSVVGPVVAEYFHATSTTATSTFDGGLSLTGGTFQQYANGVTSIENLETGTLNFETDAGWVTWVDLPVSTTTLAGTPEAFSASINGNSLLTVYAEAAGNSTAISKARVVIGTSTSAVLTSSNIPYGSLMVSDGALCVDNGAGNTCASSARTRGFVYAEGSSVAGLDLAELYPSTDQTLEAGEILMLDPNNAVNVKRYSGSASTTKPFGVISTDPGVLLGGFSDNSLNKTVPVALSGRVPVKVNLEGGNIEIGDLIAPSSVPGEGKKATESGYVIGTAIEAFPNASSTDSVLVFVDTRYVFIDTQFYVDAATGNVGVGVGSPLYKLHVGGDVAATGFVNVSTRDAKKDINYLSTTTKASVLDRLKDIGIATYHYNDEEANAPLRLGLIAEEAPQEVLSADGKGVDLYKLSTYILAGVQEQAKRFDDLAIRLDTIEARLTAAENALATLGATTTASSTISDIGNQISGSTTASTSISNFQFPISTSTDGFASSTVEVVLGWLRSIGGEIKDGVVNFVALVVDTLTAKSLTVGDEENLAAAGITVFDRATGEPVCMYVENGVMKSEAGECGKVASNDPAPSNDDDQSGGNNASTTPNTAPDANGDSNSVFMNGSILINVLGNDSDADGDDISVQGVSTPAHGTANIEGGMINYTPEQDFIGTDTFNYSITDGEDTDSATVTITVEALPDPENPGGDTTGTTTPPTGDAGDGTTPPGGTGDAGSGDQGGDVTPPAGDPPANPEPPADPGEGGGTVATP